MAESWIEQSTSSEITHRNRWLWFGLLSGPIVYSVYFIGGYLLVESSCSVDLLRGTVLGLEALSFWILAATVVAALITAFATVVALRYWRRLREDAAAYLGRERYAPFMAFVGAWLSGTFTLIILLTGVPALFVVLCSWI